LFISGGCLGVYQAGGKIWIQDTYPVSIVAPSCPDKIRRSPSHAPLMPETRMGFAVKLDRRARPAGRVASARWPWRYKHRLASLFEMGDLGIFFYHRTSERSLAEAPKSDAPGPSTSCGQNASSIGQAEMANGSLGDLPVPRPHSRRRSRWRVP